MLLRYSLCILLLYTVTTHAQNRYFTLEGTVIDSINNTVLPQATVLLIPFTDSAHTKLQLTDKQGRFSFTFLNKEKYRLRVSYVGFQPFVKSIQVSSINKLVQVEPIQLIPQVYRLNEIRVKLTSPVQLKMDTVEYNADSFNPLPNASLEGLFKKLPGIEIRSDGSVIAQGQTVQQIFVDGKPFFGDDPKMATQNLPASLIKTVQVFDRRSDKATFSGIDDGSRIKTINIITKPEGQNGLFGQQVAGAGTNGRYQAGVSLSKFGNSKQLSLIGQTNNVNQLGYNLHTLGNQSSSGNIASNSQGQSGGIIQSTGIGFNYSDNWGKRTDVNAHYIFSDALTKLEQSTLRRTISLPVGLQPDSTAIQSTLVSKNQFATLNKTDYHSLNLRVNYRLNSANIIQFLPSVSFSVQKVSSQISTHTQLGQQLLNQSIIYNTSANTSANVANSILWTHRFQQAGRTFSAELKTTINNLNSRGVNASKNTFFERTYSLDTINNQSINQQAIQLMHSLATEFNLNYTEPISLKSTLSLRYQLAINQRNSERSVIDANERTGVYDQLNPSLSSDYQSDLKTNRLGLNWQMRQPGFTYTLGLDLQQTSLNSATHTRSSVINHRYYNLLPSLLIQPKLATNRYIQFQYQTQIVTPTIAQLLPVANITNPLFIQLGNPELRPEYTHLVSLTYNSFQPKTNRTTFIFLSGGITSHRIINSTQIDTLGVQTIQPLNANGFSHISGSLSLGRPVMMTSIKSTLNLTTNLSFIRGVSLVNDQLNRSLSFQVGQVLSLNATIGETFEAGLSAQVNYQSATYSLQPISTNHSLNTLVSSQLYYILPLKFKVSTDLTYRIATGRAAGYNQAYILWNAYVSRSLLKKQQAELRLQAYDLLNQNRSIVRTVTDTYVEDGQSQVLKRYFLLSFIYNLSQFGLKKGSR